MKFSQDYGIQMGTHKRYHKNQQRILIPKIIEVYSMNFKEAAYHVLVKEKRPLLAKETY